MKNMITKSFGRSAVIFSVLILICALMDSPVTQGQIRQVSQEDAATAIATTCAALLESCARQPSLCDLTDPANMVLIDLYGDAVEDIMALNLESNPDDIAIARGITRAALILGVGRQPSLKGDLENIEAICLQDIDSL